MPLWVRVKVDLWCGVPHVNKGRTIENSTGTDNEQQEQQHQQHSDQHSNRPKGPTSTPPALPHGCFVRTMHPGDQHLPHNDRSGQPNPYSPPNPHTLSRATAQEIASLQARLDRQLGPEYISERPGAAGVRVQYLEAWKCINLANEIFGFNGWSSSIQNISVDYVLLLSPSLPNCPLTLQMDESRETGKVSLGLSVVVRVTLTDGVYHEVHPHLLRGSRITGHWLRLHRECQIQGCCI
jgi:Rad52/22 family double-strand break repair protein